MISSKHLTVAVIFFAVLFVAHASALGCPTCKEGIAAHDPAFAGMVRGYFWSIIFMMSMPFLTLGGIAGYFYYEVVRARHASRRTVATGSLVTSP